MKFFETSAKNNINVEEAFVSIARDIKKRLMDNPAAAKTDTKAGVADLGGAAKKEDGCCK
jgi:Ras-related protein Rab-8A